MSPSKGRSEPSGIRNPRRYERFVKPVFDAFVGGLLALATLPIVVLLSLLLVLTLRVKPLAREKRIGKNGQPFGLWKLRAAESVSPGVRGRRLTKFLRDLSLDELPQLWNVLAGTMSLVGPRPLSPEAAEQLADWQERRHLVKPGLTGLWQVEARGDGRDLLDNIHYDIQYMDELSFSTDLRLLAKTLVVVVARNENQTEKERDPDRLTSRFPHARLVAVDQVIWAFALAAGAFVHANFSWSILSEAGLAVGIAIAVAVQLMWGLGVGLYRGKWRLASYEEVGWLVPGTMVVLGALSVAAALPGSLALPLGAVLTAGGFQLVTSLGARYFARALYTAKGRSLHKRPHRLIVIGAGEAGLKAASSVWTDPNADSLPVAFLDDEPAKHGSRPLGLPVVGGRESIGVASYQYNADTLLIAMPSATGTAVRDIAEIGQRAGLKVRILPRLSEYVLTDGEVRAADIRELTLADFLPRDELNLDLEGIAGYLEGKRVLVTGAGGSIGSVLCRIIEQFEPKKLYKLDIDENALHGLQLALEGRALLDSDELILCDIRDQNALSAAFADAKPEVVFHAAARKHVTFLENHPGEAIKTNVYGTLNVLEASLEVDAERVVNVSTDKAADPVSILGLTKRIGEMLTSYQAKRGSTSFMSVRFGNVLGSTGSVIPTFREQILNGEPITVTDPEVTRYFMTIDEACQLVVQAGAFGGEGDVFVLNMGEPVRIVELAERLQQQLRPGAAPNIVFTGLRPGEKLHEVLAAQDEELVDHPHELLDRYSVSPLDPVTARSIPESGDAHTIREYLEDVITNQRL